MSSSTPDPQGHTRIRIATAYDEGFAEMGGLCAQHLKIWCTEQGYELHVERTMTPERPPAWTKIAVIGALMSLGADWVIWVDADALMMDPSRDIRPLLQTDKDLLLATHHQWVHPMPGMAIRYDVPNTGVMAWRNCAFSRDLLAQIWSKTDYLHHPWWENAALIELMGYHRLLDANGVNTPEAALIRHIGPLSWQWNAVPGSCDVDDPIIRHYTRRGDYAERLAEMQADADSLAEGPQ